jgi:hypothetical protein
MTVMQRKLQQREGRLRRRLRTRASKPDGLRTPADVAAPAVTVDRERRRTRRQGGGTPQDKAVYNCQCGMVFEAPVSTAVGCPHCGQTQAW